MNDKRRRTIKSELRKLENIHQRLEGLYTELGESRETIGIVFDEEQECRDNIPEALEDSQNAINSDEALENLAEASQTLEYIYDNIESSQDDFLEALETLRGVANEK